MNLSFKFNFKSLKSQTNSFELLSDDFLWLCFCFVSCVFNRCLCWFYFYESFKYVILYVRVIDFIEYDCDICFVQFDWLSCLLLDVNNMLLIYKLSFDWCFDYVSLVNYYSNICTIELARYIDFRKNASFVKDVWNIKLVDVCIW